MDKAAGVFGRVSDEERLLHGKNPVWLFGVRIHHIFIYTDNMTSSLAWEHFKASGVSHRLLVSWSFNLVR